MLVSGIRLNRGVGPEYRQSFVRHCRNEVINTLKYYPVGSGMIRLLYRVDIEQEKMYAFDHRSKCKWGSHKRGQTCYLGGCLLLQPPLCDLRLLQWLRLFMTRQWTLQ